MSPCCANSHMLLPLWAFTLRTPLYTSIFIRSVHIFYHRYVSIWTDVVQTYVCLWPCESWHLEPFCIHTYIHKYSYTCIVWCIVSYLNPCCAKSHMFAPLWVLTLWTFLFAYIYSKIYIYHVIDTFVYEPMLCELTFVSSLASLHFEAASYTSTYLQIYICHSIDTRVRIWAHAVQTHICFCPCERSHLEPLCIHQFYLKCTYFLS